MRIAARFSLKNGLVVIQNNFAVELQEILEAINAVNAAQAFAKVSEEKTMPGKTLYSPKLLNAALLGQLYQWGWQKPKVRLSTVVPEVGHRHTGNIVGDGMKNGLGLEVQYGKYAFLGWDIFGKMPIFAQAGLIKAGVEVVPMPSLQRQMSTGIGSFAQNKAVLEARGESDLDIPLLVLGVDV